MPPTPNTSPSKLHLGLDDVTLDWHFHVSKVVFDLDGAFFRELKDDAGDLASALQTILQFWAIAGGAHIGAQLGDMAALGTWIKEQTWPTYEAIGWTVADPVEDPPAFGDTPPYDGTADSWGATPPGP